MNRSTNFGGEFFSTIRLAYSAINPCIPTGLHENTEAIYIRLRRKDLRKYS